MKTEVKAGQTWEDKDSEQGASGPQGDTHWLIGPDKDPKWWWFLDWDGKPRKLTTFDLHRNHRLLKDEHGNPVEAKEIPPRVQCTICNELICVNAYGLQLCRGCLHKVLEADTKSILVNSLAEPVEQEAEVPEEVDPLKLTDRPERVKTPEQKKLVAGVYGIHDQIAKGHYLNVHFRAFQLANEAWSEHIRQNAVLGSREVNSPAGAVLEDSNRNREG